MPDEIRINEKNNFIEVISRDTLTYEDMENTKRQIAKLHSQKGLDKIFIDTTKLISVATTTDIFRAMENCPPNIKIAILILESRKISEEIVFGETVASTRGILIRTFTDKKKAKEWLMTI